MHPKKKPLAYDKEAVLVISDWSDENADQIAHNLRKDGDYYLRKKDSMRSYLGAWLAGGLKNQLGNEWQRMGGMDLSDVGYDAFLINGKRDAQSLNARPGEKLRLRIINAGASSYFYVAMGIPMQVISADGVDVQPKFANEILIGMAETYDVLVTLPKEGNFELRATVQDVTGFASAWIGAPEAPKVYAPTKPLPDYYAPMNHGDHGNHAHHTAHGDHGNHANHFHDSKPSIDWSDQSDAQLRQNSARRNLNSASNKVETMTVDALTAIEPTSFPAHAKVHDIKLVLGGDMERYIWHLNGKTIQQDRLILINRGEVVRFTFVNETMMHHPMHLHGHFFRVINSSGEKSPLKHTVDVPPHGTRIIEFLANEPGQWMLHCHNLYHMKTGMARIIRYNDFKLTPEMQKHDRHDPHLHEHLYAHTVLEGATNQAKARFRLMRTWDELNLELESTKLDGRTLQLGKKWENEGDFAYRRWFSNFFHLFGGASLYHEKVFAVAGLGYVLPMLLETRVYLNHEGKIRLDLERQFQWTKNIFSRAEVKWRPDWGGDRDLEFDISLMYGPSWHWAAGFLFTERSVGIGAQLQF